MINNYETFDVNNILNENKFSNTNGINFIPYKFKNKNGIFFQTPPSEIINIEHNKNNILYTIKPLKNFNEFYNFNVKIDNYNIKLSNNLSIVNNSENYISVRKLPDKIDDKYFLSYKANLNNEDNLECEIYDDLKNKINDKNILEIGTKVSFIIKLSGLLYNNYKIIPYWTIQQIKIITLDYNINFSECMIKDDYNTFIDIKPENFD
jgi:hypothetical protein